MYQMTQRVAQPYYGMNWQERPEYTASEVIACNWKMLRQELLMQWRRISASELDKAGPFRTRIASLIERKYGISSRLVENYLRNFERTMPLSG